MISFCIVLWSGVIGEIVGASLGAILQAVFGMVVGSAALAVSIFL